MEFFKKYGLSESKFYEMVSSYLRQEKVDALNFELSCLDGTNDFFMSNIKKLDVKAFSETGEGVATIKTLHLVVKTEVPGVLQKVHSITYMLEIQFTL